MGPPPGRWRGRDAESGSRSPLRLLVGAVGCGGDGGGGDGGGGGNGGNELPDYLCDLFTVEEIEAIVDRPLEQDDEISNNLVCKWNNPALGYHGYGAHVEFLPGYAYGFDGHISHIEGSGRRRPFRSPTSERRRRSSDSITIPFLPR